MDLKKIIVLVILFVLAGYSSAFAVEDAQFSRSVEIKDGASLSMIDCIAVAFKNSPKVKQKKYQLDIAQSNVGIAKSQYFPVISVGAGFYNENNSDSGYYNSHYRELPTVALAVNKLVWNFGKTTAYIKMEEFYKIGAEYEFMDSLCNTIFDVKLRYYELLRAKALLKVAQENVNLNEKFLTLAKNKEKSDLKTAELNLSAAKIDLIEAKNNYKNSILDMNNTMYIETTANYTLKDTPTFSSKFNLASENLKLNDFSSVKFPFDAENAVELAYQNSPDLNVLVSTKHAMEQSLLFIKRTYLPDLNVDAKYGFNNSNYSANNSLQVGVNLSSSVNLMELKHSIKGAKAQLNLADNEIDLFKKNLYFEVKKSLNNCEKTQNQIAITKMKVLQADENLKAVEDKYTTGELNYIALQDARKDYINSLETYVSNIYDYNIALIKLEMAMHYHLVDIHHKSKHAVHYHSTELIEHINEVLDCDEAEEK